MDSYSSGEEVVIKTRKPYTITKQRERWTEDEHTRFLEALKLYGRAWQRIEEHIGSKTAVQIRSHAQKFFTKLEKESLLKGIPLGQALDIEIPPPRPKRKPSNPYPRKIITYPASQLESLQGKSVRPTSSLPQPELTIDLENKPLPEKMGDENLGNGTEYQDGDSYPKKCNLVQGSLGTSSSVNKSSSPALMAPKNCYTCNEVVPALDEGANMDESHVTVEPGANQILHEFCSMQSFEEKGTCKEKELDEKLNRTKGIKLKQCETFERGPKDDWQFAQTQARHASVQILDGSSSLSAPNVFHDTLTNLSSCEDHCGGAGSSVNQTFHPNFGPVQDPDNYQSLVHVSSIFSNLIISALLPNPAVHAAARFAASFWPTPNIDASASQINAAPSVAAIAAATVAAATAWWASNGLLPVCAPYHYVPVAPSMNQKTEETTQPALESEICKEQHTTWKSASDGLKSLAVCEVPDSDKVKGRKQMDRSSCGSNTASSSEVDTDALEKHGKGVEESREPTTSDRRSRGSSSTTDSWKEVSQEGRQAFHALFSRQVLPQSFSPPYALNNSRGNSNSCCTGDEGANRCISQQAVNNPFSNLKEEGQHTLGKLKGCTGFKPYKRFSVEAKDSVLVNAGKEEEEVEEGKGPKRIRLDNDAYTHC